MSVERSLKRVPERKLSENKESLIRETTYAQLKEDLEKIKIQLEENIEKNIELKNNASNLNKRLEDASESIEKYKGNKINNFMQFWWKFITIIGMLKDSNELLKSMITTYFIFIDFYKQVQSAGNNIQWSDHQWGLSIEIEKLLGMYLRLY